MITDDDRWAREDDREERADERRRDSLWLAAQQRTDYLQPGEYARRGRNALLPSEAPAGNLIAGRAEFVIDAAGNPLARADQGTSRDPRSIAAEILATARADRNRHEIALFPELAAVTFDHAAHHCAVVAARLLLDDAADPRASLTRHARAYAAAFALLSERAVRARAAWAARPTEVAA